MEKVLPVFHYRSHIVQFPYMKYEYLCKSININRKQHHVFSVLKVSSYTVLWDSLFSTIIYNAQVAVKLYS